MIVYDLHCDEGHRFEGWFGSSSDYAEQRERGLVSCPQCGSPEVSKAPMAPAVPVKGNAAARPEPTGKADTAPAADTPQPGQAVSNRPVPKEVEQALAALAKAQARALEKSTWVGEKFAEQSRKMHYGETDEKPIHGQASVEEAQGLIEEGIAVAPLPFPVSPPEELN